MMNSIVLHVDLDTGVHHLERLDEKVTQQYLGGMGLANYLASRLIPEGISPDSPKNKLIFAAGLFGGTMAPASAKIMATTKLPANGAIGTCFGGGSMGAKLKWAGYDSLVITGKAEKPIYLVVHDDAVEIKPAEDLWGTDTVETTHRLWDLCGGDASVIAIGPAGENKVKFSFTMVDNMGTLGRGGLGAVMGGKNLKAVVVKGTKGVQPSDSKKFLKLTMGRKKMLETIPWRNDWLKFGIYTGWPVWKQIALIRKNFTELAPEEEAEKLNPQAYEKYFRYPLACTSCPMADKAVVGLRENGNEVEYAIAYGMHGIFAGIRYGGIDEGKALAVMIEANKAGIDDVMLSSIIELAIDLFKHGIITINDTGGERLDHNIETFERLSYQIINRESIGDILAEGYYGIINHFGVEAARYAHHVKGLDFMIDPRPAISGFTYAQLTNPRGSYAIAGGSPAFSPGRKANSIARFLKNIGANDAAIERVVDPPDDFNLARMLKHTEDWYALCSSLGICARQPIFQVYDMETISKLVKAFTGWDKTATELIQDGERIWNMSRYVNMREGFSKNHDKMPDVFFRPLGTEKGDVPLMDYHRRQLLQREDIETGMTEYYQERGWDVKSGNPSEEKLKELEIV